jgi:hypothetical protein
MNCLPLSMFWSFVVSLTIVFCSDGHEHCCWRYFVVVGIDFNIAMLLFVSFSVAFVFFVVLMGCYWVAL